MRRWKQGLKGPLLLKANQSLQLSCNIHAADVFLPDVDAEKGLAKAVLTNCLGFTVGRGGRSSTSQPGGVHRNKPGSRIVSYYRRVG